MKVLITGAGGQVAFELQRSWDAKIFSVVALPKAQLDITDAILVSTMLSTIRPDAVINTAAYTQVDQAEENSEIAYAVNRDGAKNLAIACEKIKCPLIHLSTDYIFDGQKEASYLETDLVMPLSIYGKSKWAGEEAIRQHCEAHIIIRVSAVFAATGSNFVKTILRLAKEKEILRVVNDQTTCPTPAKEIAIMLWQLCKKVSTQPAWGTYHFCGGPAVSWYAFAKEIIQQYPPEILQIKELKAISSAEYLTAAQRPHYSVLDCQQLEKTFAIKQPDWQKGLKDVINELSTH